MLVFEYGSHEGKAHFLSNIPGDFILHINKCLNYPLVFRLAKINKHRPFNEITLTTGS